MTLSKSCFTSGDPALCLFLFGAKSLSEEDFLANLLPGDCCFFGPISVSSVFVLSLLFSTKWFPVELFTSLEDLLDVILLCGELLTSLALFLNANSLSDLLGWMGLVGQLAATTAVSDTDLNKGAVNHM